jgi:hypothetical protein
VLIDTRRILVRAATLRIVFHVQLRQFPNVSREFNLAEDELRARIVTPWLAGQVVQSGDRGWAPERARLTIYEGPELRPDQISMGRGWQNVTRAGEDVTSRFLARPTNARGSSPAVQSLKQRVLDAASLELRDSVRLAGEIAPGSRVSERLGLAEQAVWELLHEGRLQLRRADGIVDAGQWQSVLLSWASWEPGGGAFVEPV